MLKIWIVTLLVLAFNLYPLLTPTAEHNQAGQVQADNSVDVCSDSDEDGQCDENGSTDN